MFVHSYFMQLFLFLFQAIACIICECNTCYSKITLFVSRVFNIVNIRVAVIYLFFKIIATYVDHPADRSFVSSVMQ